MRAVESLEARFELGELSRRANKVFKISTRTVVPAFIVAASYGSICLYFDRAFLFLASGTWLTLSHLLLPLAFLIVHLTNRRYGPGYAFAQIVFSLAICGAVAAARADLICRLLPLSATPSVREVSAFVVAFLAAGFFSTVAFDAARGPRWWLAPLTGSLVAGSIYALIFFPAAYAGTETFWCVRMVTYAGVFVGFAVFSLIPYWLLRASIQPLSGLGGY